MNNLKLTSLSRAIKVGGVAISTLSPDNLEALAYAQSVGTRATASVSERQAWTASAIACIAIQEAYSENADRIAKAQEHKTSIISLLRSAIVMEQVQQLSLAKDVRAGTAKDAQGTKIELDSPQTLVMRATKKLDNYYDARLMAAWEHGLVIEYDTDTSGNILPESAGKLFSRVKAKQVSDAPATGQSDLTGALGRFSGNLNALLSDQTTLESSAACKELLDSAYAVLARHFAGVLSNADVHTIAVDLFAIGAEVQEEPLTDTSGLEPEAKDAPAAVAVA